MTAPQGRDWLLYALIGLAFVAIVTADFLRH